MKKIILVLFLFLLQNYLITQGLVLFSKLVLPFVIFTISCSIAVWYFRSIRYAGTQAKRHSSASGSKVIGTAGGMLSILLLWNPVRQMLVLVPDPSTGSDIVPQLAALYHRFLLGVQPYYPLEQLSWHPFPVYMPLHWLPLGIGYSLHIDIRWVGYIFMACSCATLGYCFRSDGGMLKRLFAITLPALALYLFASWDTYGLSVSYELIIAAYYLLLCAGLISGNLVLIAAGIITCILSRYTFVFWLPLFAILLWQNATKKQNILLWLSVALSVLLMYVIPFWLRDPTIFSKGLAYHNACYVDAWNGLGHPESSTAFDAGLNFSWFICHSVGGDMYHRVFIARVIQALLMLSLLIGGAIMYRRWKDKVQYNQFALGMLYCFMMVFYIFSPYTFLYYYLPLQCISAVLCGQIILSNVPTVNISGEK